MTVVGPAAYLVPAALAAPALLGVALLATGIVALVRRERRRGAVLGLAGVGLVVTSAALAVAFVATPLLPAGILLAASAALTLAGVLLLVRPPH